MSSPKKFDAVLAERNLRVLAEQVEALTMHLNHAREDLADYAERVAELERERDAYAQVAVTYRREKQAAERRAVEAARRGPQRGFVDGAEWYASWGAPLSHAQRLIVRYQAEQEVERREYPATREEPTPAAPEPLCDQCQQPLADDESRDHDNPKRHTIRGCNRALGRALKRIVALAQTTEG